MLTEEILNTEPPSNLEDSDTQHGKVFRKERYQGLAGSLLFNALGAGIFALMGAGKGRALLGAELGSLFGIPVNLYFVYRWLAGPPHAESTPEATVKRYLHYCLFAGLQGGHDTVGMEGFLFLLCIARQHYADVEAFKKYWQETNCSIRKELRDKFNFQGGELLASHVVDKIDVNYQGQRIANCSVTISMPLRWSNGKLATEDTQALSVA